MSGQKRIWLGLFALCISCAAHAAFAEPFPASRSNLKDQEMLQAASLGRTEQIRTLLQKGADYNAVSNDPGEKSALLLAVESGDVRTVEALVDAGSRMGKTAVIGVDDRTTLEQVTPLARAVMQGKTDIADFLIDRGAEPLPAVMVRKLTPMGQVTRAEQPLLLLAKDEATARLLLRSGADANDAASDGTTPLMRAAMRGDNAMAQALIEAGADTAQRRSGDGATAASLAAKSGYAALSGKLNPKPVTRTRPSLRVRQ